MKINEIRNYLATSTETQINSLKEYGEVHTSYGTIEGIQNQIANLTDTQGSVFILGITDDNIKIIKVSCDEHERHLL